MGAANRGACCQNGLQPENGVGEGQLGGIRAVVWWRNLLFVFSFWKTGLLVRLHESFNSETISPFPPCSFNFITLQPFKPKVLRPDVSSEVKDFWMGRWILRGLNKASVAMFWQWGPHSDLHALDTEEAKVRWSAARGLDTDRQPLNTLACASLDFRIWKWSCLSSWVVFKWDGCCEVIFCLNQYLSV